MDLRLNSIQAICHWDITKTEEDFLHSYLNWRNYKIIKAHSSADLSELNLERKPSEEAKFCTIWKSPTDSRIRELLEVNMEVLGMGRINHGKKKELTRLGLGRFFESMDVMNQLPLEFLPPREKSLVFWVFTGKRWLDSILLSLIRSYGHRALNPLEGHHFFHQIREERPDIAILDWDYFLEEDRSFFNHLSAYSSNHPLPFFLGIKDFNKQGISQDLSKWISKYSFVSFPYERLINVLVFSLLPMDTKSKFSLDEVRSIVWEEPSRGKVQKANLEFIPHPQRLHPPFDIHTNWLWFNWLRDESLFL